MVNKLIDNILLSILLIGVYTELLFLLYYPSKGEFGPLWGVVYLYMLTGYAGPYLGILAIILRLCRVFKTPTNLIYILICVLNLILGIIGISLFIFWRAELFWFHDALFNLLVGVLMVADIILFATKPAKSKNIEVS